MLGRSCRRAQAAHHLPHRLLCSGAGRPCIMGSSHDDYRGRRKDKHKKDRKRSRKGSRDKKKKAHMTRSSSGSRSRSRSRSRSGDRELKRQRCEGSPPRLARREESPDPWSLSAPPPSADERALLLMQRAAAQGARKQTAGLGGRGGGGASTVNKFQQTVFRCAACGVDSSGEVAFLQHINGKAHAGVHLCCCV